MGVLVLLYGFGAVGTNIHFAIEGHADLFSVFSMQIDLLRTDLKRNIKRLLSKDI